MQTKKGTLFRAYWKSNGLDRKPIIHSQMNQTKLLSFIALIP